jgi:hypothetical protein
MRVLSRFLRFCRKPGRTSMRTVRRKERRFGMETLESRKLLALTMVHEPRLQLGDMGLNSATDHGRK